MRDRGVGGYDGRYDGGYDGGISGIGGYDDDAEDYLGNPLKSKMHRRVSRVKAQKEIINKDFIVRLNRHYTDLLEAINVMAPLLGTTIPLSHKTELLRDAFDHLADNETASSNETMTLEIVIGYNIDPFLRYIHIQNIKPCGWVRIEKFIKIDDERADDEQPAL